MSGSLKRKRMAEGLGLLKKEEPCRMVRCGSEANGGAAGKAAPQYVLYVFYSVSDGAV